MGTGMHHVLVVCKVVCFCHYIGYNGRMFRKKSLVINFLPLELLPKLREGFHPLVHCLATACLDRLAGALRVLLYRYADPWEPEVLKM